MTSHPNISKVSIIVPCYNEIDYISSFIGDLRTQDYASEKMEFFIVDGGSKDGTVEVLEKIISIDPRFNLLHNPKRTAPHALNIAIDKASGDFIVRMDVHASYPKSYISTLLNKFHSQEQLGNVGAVLITVPANNLPKAKGIALAMASSLGVGGAKFRTGINRDTLVDTVPFGCFPKNIFQDVGKFNENLTRSQDYEFNTRIKSKGYKILLTPDIKVKYYARESYTKLIVMYYQSAFTKVLSNKLMGTFGNYRQFIPPLFFFLLFLSVFVGIIHPPFLNIALLTLVLYNFILGLSSFFSVINQKSELKVAPFMSFAILCMHISYAIGYIKGLIVFFILGKNQIVKNLKITR